MGQVWVFQPYNNPNTNLKNNTKIGHWAQNQASAMTIPVIWPEPCRKWVRRSTVMELWIWRIWRDYIITPVFSVTWSFRNHTNTLISCKKHLVLPMLKTVVLFNILKETMVHFSEDYFMNIHSERKEFILNINIFVT